MNCLQSVVFCVSAVLSAAPPSDPEIVCQGLVKLIESVEVSASRDGKLDKIMIREGLETTRGTVLGQLNDVEAKMTFRRTQLEHQLAVERARSDVALNSARLIQEVSRNEFQRAVQARQAAPNSISITEFDRLKLEFEKSTNEVTRLAEEKRFAAITAESKEAELELAKLALEERRIVSPLDGVVVQLHRREGEWVRTGEKVFRIVRIDRLRVEGFVEVHAVSPSLVGAPVQFEIAHPDLPVQMFTGEIVFVHPEADPVNGQVRIWAEIENPERLLRPGQRGRLVVGSRKGVPNIQSIRRPVGESKAE